MVFIRRTLRIISLENEGLWRKSEEHQIVRVCRRRACSKLGVRRWEVGLEEAAASGA